MRVVLSGTGPVAAGDRARAKALRAAALSWFRENGRSFPWRDTRDPYRILVAEVCLQKTNADKVLPVFKSLINAYPALHALAEADADELSRYFSQLGLIKRAGFLLGIARAVVDHHDGVIPRDRQALLKVKGIGDYTANSVVCLAYGDRLPLLDGSTQRLLARVFNRRLARPAWADTAMRHFMQAILPKNHVREFNLALIDIAAKCCRPRKPRCAACPLQALCLASAAIGRSPNGS